VTDTRPVCKIGLSRV